MFGFGVAFAYSSIPYLTNPQLDYLSRREGFEKRIVDLIHRFGLVIAEFVDGCKKKTMSTAST